jgi:glutathione-specific gamma-glutamylcyclotransferase
MVHLEQDLAARTGQTMVHGITRECLQDGVLRDKFKAVAPSAKILTLAAHRRSLARTLRARPDGGGDVWLFAYGSLMWNPMIRFRAKRIARISGYHRRLCLWSHLYRGSPSVPGLVLGLVPGGHCRGVVYRIAAREARAELLLIWQREMINGGYHPTWLRTVTAGGRGWAIGFATDRWFRGFAGRLPDEHVADIVARAKGYAGSCAHYVFDTVAHLDSLGLRDPGLALIRDHVRQLIDK